MEVADIVWQNAQVYEVFNRADITLTLRQRQHVGQFCGRILLNVSKLLICDAHAGIRQWSIEQVKTIDLLG